MMDACGAGSATDLRNTALLAILCRAGLRITEALELRPKDLDLANGMVRVLYGNGGMAGTGVGERRTEQERRERRDALGRIHTP